MQSNQKMYFQKSSKSFAQKRIHIEIHPRTEKSRRKMFQWHWHDYYELEIFLKGTGIERMNNRSISMQRGSIALVTPIGCHELELDDKSNILNIQFSGVGMSQALLKRLQGMDGCIYQSEENEFQDVLAILNLMQKEYDQNHADELQHLLEWLLLFLLRSTEKQINLSGYDENIIEIINYIHHHFMEKLSVSQISKRFGYNTTYMGAMFKSRIGMSINTYLKNIRMNYAYSLLIGSNMTIEQISEQAGFCDRTYFSTQFKKKYKKTPAECRAEHNRG